MLNYKKKLIIKTRYFNYYRGYHNTKFMLNKLFSLHDIKKIEYLIVECLNYKFIKIKIFDFT